MTIPAPPKQPSKSLDIDPRTKFPRLPEGMIFEVTPPKEEYHSLVSGFLRKPARIKVLKWSDEASEDIYGEWSEWKYGIASGGFTRAKPTCENRRVVDKPARWPFVTEKAHSEFRTRSCTPGKPGYTEEVERWAIGREEYTPEGIMALAGKMADTIWKREALKPLLGKHEPIGRSDLPEEIQVTLRLSHVEK